MLQIIRQTENTYYLNKANWYIINFYTCVIYGTLSKRYCHLDIKNLKQNTVLFLYYITATDPFMLQTANSFLYVLYKQRSYIEQLSVYV